MKRFIFYDFSFDRFKAIAKRRKFSRPEILKYTVPRTCFLMLIVLINTNSAAAQISVPAAIEFGNVEVDDSLSMNVIIKNMGSESVIITNFSDPGTPFALSDRPNLPFEIAPEDSEVLNVLFMPSGTGTFTAKLVITTDDVNDQTLNIELSGTGFILNAAKRGACYASIAKADSSSLIKINPSTGAGSPIGNTGLSYLQNIAINSKGKIYGSDNQGNLYRIDALTGQAVLISSPGLGPINGMAFDNNDTLYTVAGYNGPWRWGFQYLYTVDPTSGASNLIGEIEVRITGLSFDPAHANLWGSDYNSVYMIDKFTAISTLIGNTDFDYELTDLQFDIAGNLFATAGGDYFAGINKTTGAGSLIGEIGFQPVSGLAFYNEPVEGKHISVVPSVIDFGFVEVKDDRIRTISISNIGSEDLTIMTISDPDMPFSFAGLPELPLVIPTGSSEYLNISFTPAERNEFNSSFMITSNDEDNPEISVLLNGNGLILSHADSGACYSVTADFDSSKLLQIDPATGKGTLIGMTGAQFMQRLAINSDGKIYGTGNGGKIYGIDPVSGRAIFRSDPQLGGISGMVFDNRDSLYVISDRNLYILNPNTGSSRYIGDTGFWLDGLSFNPVESTFWAIDNGSLYTINAANAAATLIKEFEYQLTDIQFDVAGNLYAISRNNDENYNLLSINEMDGSIYDIGGIGFRSVEGFGFYRVPVPGKHIRIIPIKVDFGYVEIGDSTSGFANISNIGTESITISSISDPGPPFNLPDLPVVLPSTASKKMEFIFTPLDTGTFISEVSVISDDEDNPAINVTLNAQGIYIAPAEPGGCYALLEGDYEINNGKFLKIDLQTGAAEIIGVTGYHGYKWDLVIDSGGKIFGIEKWTGNVYRIDAATGKTWFISYLGLFDTKYEKNDRLVAVAFDSSDLLYGVGYPMYESGLNLYKIDLDKRTVKIINNYSEYSPDGIAFDPTDNKFWSFSSSAYGGYGYNYLYSIDLMTAKDIFKREATVANVPSNFINDVYFDLSGNLYAVAGSYTKYFIFIDKTTGNSTEIGKIGNFQTEFSGLAIYNVPLPGKHMRVVPKNINFKQAAVGDSLLRVFTVNNIGTDDLTINSITVPGSPFIVNNIPSLPDVLSSAESKKLEVIFAAANSGNLNRNITIKSDDEDNPELNVSLHAEALAISLADSGVFYASTDGNQLLEINPLTGQGNIIGSTESYDLSGLAINSLGEIYGSDWNGNLFRVDALTGKVYFLLCPGFGAIPGIAFDKNDVLYATPNYDGLYMVDPVSGNSDYFNLAGDGSAYFKGLSFNPVDGSLWGSDGTNIFKINLSTKKRTLIGEITSDWYDRANGLTFDDEGNLFATIQNLNDNESSYFASIDKNNGRATFIGKIGYLNVGGLAFHSKIIASDFNALINNIPEIFALNQNYPNPFNPTTTIEFSIPKSEFATLKIYDILGQETATLVSERLSAGNYKYEWDAGSFASGIYYYRLVAGGYTGVKKMIFIR